MVWKLGSLVKAGFVMDAWRNSPDHWVWVNGRCDFWGYALATAGGVSYACGIFADIRVS